jgi:D-3-phosphoglycerate dehydrogenase
MGRIAAEQLLEALDGNAPLRLINPQAWSLYARRFEQILGSRPIAPPRSI